MTTVLAALDSDASARPVLSTAIALADLLDATVTCLHVVSEALAHSDIPVLLLPVQ